MDKYLEIIILSLFNSIFFKDIPIIVRSILGTADAGECNSIVVSTMDGQIPRKQQFYLSPRFHMF